MSTLVTDSAALPAYATRSTSMQALVQDGFGLPARLALRDLPAPQPGDGQLLVRIHAAALNAADAMIIRGNPVIARLIAGGLRQPRANNVIGRDLAGTVVATGAGVSGWQVGDAVLAEHPGALAEYVVIPAKVAVARPDSLPFEIAAALPTAGVTALQGIRDKGEVKPGQRVLINGATGGVGSFAVQIARHLGAEVTAVCSAANAEFARSLGATQVIDYAKRDFTRDTGTYDVIFDLIGNHSLGALKQALRSGGILVLSSGSGGPILGPIPRLAAAAITSPFSGRKLRPFAASANPADLATLRQLVASGAVTPAIDRVVPLSDAESAVAHLLTGHARGKIVVRVAPEPAA